jgi:hypothetical protein
VKEIELLISPLVDPDSLNESSAYFDLWVFNMELTEIIGEKDYTNSIDSVVSICNMLLSITTVPVIASRKEKLKPLSIRVKPHTKEFFKNHSILSPRDVLEMYENFNNGSEAFINSLIEEEKELEKELVEVQEKLHNAKLFKEKLSELEIDGDVLTDEDKLVKLQNQFGSSQIKSIGNETPVDKAKSDIIRDIQIYNTLDVSVYDDEYLVVTVYTNAQPVVYYFKNEYSKDDISEIISEVEEFCDKNKIDFRKSENSD